jgi:BirA family biotin operon repressor/biotin-[acetyl-CoA-carboxylase] ligase
MTDGKKSLDIERIKRFVGDKVRIIYYPSTDSTNTKAREYARDGWDGKRTVFIAKRQSAGRGRRGRSFLSDDGGIYLSLLSSPTEKDSSAASITASAAVKILAPIEEATGSVPLIKWVNDIYVSGKKVAGILTEGEFDTEGNLRYYVLGIGINVYKNPDLCLRVPIASTLEDNTDREIDINLLAAEIILQLLEENTGSELSVYRERSFVVGKRVRVICADREYEATAQGIAEDFSLEVIDEDGQRRFLSSGEVSVREAE